MFSFAKKTKMRKNLFQLKDSSSPLIEVVEAINKIGAGISGGRGKEKKLRQDHTFQTYKRITRIFVAKVNEV
jgi:hypothetical protein